MGVNLLLNRRRMAEGFIPMYHGIPVLMDGMYFTRYNGTRLSRIEQSPDYFIAGWADSGSTSSKKYDLYVPSGAQLDTKLRFFNDTAATSVDYWTMETRVFTSAGRFILMSVYKPIASQIYLKLYDSGLYLFKGDNVQ